MEDEKFAWVIVPEGHYDSVYTPTPTAVYSSKEDATRAVAALEQERIRMAEEYGTMSGTRTGYTIYSIPLDADPEDLLDW